MTVNGIMGEKGTSWGHWTSVFVTAFPMRVLLVMFLPWRVRLYQVFLRLSPRPHLPRINRGIVLGVCIAHRTLLGRCAKLWQRRQLQAG